MTYLSIFPAALCSFTLYNLLQHAHAQGLQGCAAVHCPSPFEDRPSPRCQVASTDMTLIGLLTTQSQLFEDDLTWTVGDSGLQSTIEPGSYERTVTRSFYMGTSKSVDLASSNLSFKGCAIFVASPETGAYQVRDQGAPHYASSASCVGSMGENCVNDLNAKVIDLARYNADADVSDFCENIAVDLQGSPPSSCYILSQQPCIEAVALTGPYAQQAITPSENSTSNCWPTLPKTNDLTKIFEYNQVAQLDDTSLWLGYTPLISVFAPVGNNTDMGVEVNVACMKIVDSDDFSLGAARNGSGTEDMKGGTARLSGDWMDVAFFVGAWLVAWL